MAGRKDDEQIDLDGSSRCHAGKGSDRKETGELHCGMKNVLMNRCLMLEVIVDV